MGIYQLNLLSTRGNINDEVVTKQTPDLTWERFMTRFVTRTRLTRLCDKQSGPRHTQTPATMQVTNTSVRSKSTPHVYCSLIVQNSFSIQQEILQQVGNTPKYSVIPECAFGSSYYRYGVMLVLLAESDLC